MTNENLLWYASYGSNAFRERFHCYIRGGKIAGNIREYTGCRNPSLPLDEKNIIIPHQLYFAKKSKSWSHGGVGFIKHEKTDTDRTYGRMYLITQEQFADVVKQETRSKTDVSIDFDTVGKHGYQQILDNVWYGRILSLGKEDQYPIVTFTNTANLTDINPPSTDYLKTLIKGLMINFRLADPEMLEYFHKKPGIHGNFTQHELLRLMTAARMDIQ